MGTTLTQNQPSQEEDKGNKVGQSHFDTNGILTHMENKTPHQSSIKGSPHQGFNLVPRNYFIPKIDMRNHDGNDPITWLFYMEQLFDLHQVPILQKVTIASLYLEHNQFLWYQ